VAAEATMVTRPPVWSSNVLSSTVDLSSALFPFDQQSFLVD
jgi:hypothetical protein